MNNGSESAIISSMKCVDLLPMSDDYCSCPTKGTILLLLLKVVASYLYEITDADAAGWGCHWGGKNKPVQGNFGM